MILLLKRNQTSILLIQETLLKPTFNVSDTKNVIIIYDGDLFQN